MRRFLSRALLALALAGGVPVTFSSAAEGLRELRTGVDSKGWEAVGRIDFAGTGFCTGALIAPDLVLTAAHCLYDPQTGRLLPLDRMQFLAGWRSGRAEAYRSVRRAVAHPSYANDGADKAERLAWDIAVLKLDRPIRLPGVLPFATGSRPSTGAEVGLVSYAQGREGTPSIERMCHVLDRRGGILLLSCHVDFGASGAPVFVLEEGRPRIVSVISALVEGDGERMALGATVDEVLPAVLTELEILERDLPLRSFAGLGGARFLRP